MDEETPGGRAPVRRHWLNLAGCAEPSGLARRHVRRALAACASPERVEDAVLVVSELVGNTVRHTVGGPDCMCVEVYGNAAVLWVHDSGRDVSAVRTPSATTTSDELADSGLGLFLIEELTAGWLVRPTAIGKEVVVVLPLDAGGLSERNVLPYLPAVRPSLAAQFDQLDGGHGEFNRRERTKP
ncbi:ATP-binding protein [Streptomyces acidiscabies]|uniref:ATP-binding protein n=1 Tax=Streptomyces acidiscabies TaxID=42234 RepID=UPI0038F7AA74